MGSPTAPVGSRFGRYEIEALIGSGGMGDVYRARDTRLNRTVAIKVLPADVSASPERRERLEREALVISRLNHPHVRALYDVGAHDGSAFLVMEYLEGETLESRLAKRPLPPAQALTCAVQIAEALDAAHREGIVHGDVKPANIMLTSSGAKLLDFGVARLWERVTSAEEHRRRATTLSEGSSVPGTTAYMAPEQLEGGEADPRSDIFSLGVVLYEMLSGRRPFDAPTRARVIAAILEHEPPSLDKAREAAGDSRRSPVASTADPLPPALVRAVMKALAKDPDARWQNARDLASELRWL